MYFLNMNIWLIWRKRASGCSLQQKCMQNLRLCWIFQVFVNTGALCDIKKSWSPELRALAHSLRGRQNKRSKGKTWHVSGKVNRQAVDTCSQGKVKADQPNHTTWTLKEQKRQNITSSLEVPVKRRENFNFIKTYAELKKSVGSSQRNLTGSGSRLLSTKW